MLVLWSKESEVLKASSAVTDLGEDLCDTPKDLDADKKADADVRIKNNNTVADAKTSDVKSGRSALAHCGALFITSLLHLHFDLMN